MKISEQQTLQFGEESSISLPADPHASHIAQQESERARMMIATSGRKCLEQFEKFNRATLWAKTFAGLLIGMEGWYSTRCKLTWKLKATKCSRFYFQLQVSTLPTDETGYGLLPTPTVMNSDGIKNLRADSNILQGGKHSVSLTHMFHFGLLPTPAASDWKGQYTMDTVEKREQESSRGVRLPEEITRLTGSTSQLNPLFVTEMMGFPSDWLTLPFQGNTEHESLQESKPMEDGEKKV
jgi:hypothetical protein